MTLALEPTAEEQALAGRVLAVTKCEASGILGPEAAIAVFQRSGLSFELLRDIWNLADRNGSGDLSRDELLVAIRLMGWMQQSEVALSGDLVEKAGPLVKLEGITNLIAREPSPSFTIKTPMFPAVSMAEIRNYGTMFQRMGASNGLLESEKVTEAFMTSNLSYQDIWRVKQLVDTTARGSLEFREFALGMFIIQALQSCLIPEVPSSIPADLNDQFKDIQQPSPSPPPPSAIDKLRHRASVSLPSASLRSYASTPILQHSLSQQPQSASQDGISWDISPEQQKNAESLFEKLDSERKGYLDMQTAAKFMLTYRLPQEDLGRIWILSDVNRDKKLTLDEFITVMHLIQQRLQGAPIPDKLPASLKVSPVSPSPVTPPNVTAPNVSPTQKAKPPPPPPKKAGLTVSPTLLARSRTSIGSPSATSASTSMSPPLSPMSRRASTVTPASTSFLTNAKRPARPPSPELQSPFEDPDAESHFSSGSSRQPSQAPAPTESPRQPDSSRVEVLEETFRKETARLSKQVDMLLGQLTEQSTLRKANEALTTANSTLKTQLHDMERTVSEVLSANDRVGSEEQYMQEIARLNAELAAKETENYDSQRRLATLSEDFDGLKASLRDAQAKAAEAHREADGLRQANASQADELEQMRARVADMGKAMAEPGAANNTRELRMLLHDVTQDNEKLKAQLRDMKKEMEVFLLSSRSPTQIDELKRENRRLKEQVHDMEIMVATVQSSTSAVTSGSRASRGSETVARENDQLKQQLRDGQRAYADLRSNSETKIVELQQKVEGLERDNNQLKQEARRNQPPPEDTSVPPPSYDDSFVIPS